MIKESLDKMASCPDTHFSLLSKVISGGQTGADQGGLEAAKILGLETGGYIPYGFLTSEGPRPDLKDSFNLTELPPMNLSKAYIQRSKMNVDQSQGTLVFRFKASSGTDKTIGYCYTRQWIQPHGYYENVYRPVYIVDSFNVRHIPYIRNWLSHYKISILNIAGHRASPDLPDFQAQVRNFLLLALSNG